VFEVSLDYAVKPCLKKQQLINKYASMSVDLTWGIFMYLKVDFV
jgi:hypothetical protein